MSKVQVQAGKGEDAWNLKHIRNLSVLWLLGLIATNIVIVFSDEEISV